MFGFFFPSLTGQDTIKTIFCYARIKQCGKNTRQVLEAISILSLSDIKCSRFTITAKNTIVWHRGLLCFLARQPALT